MAPTSKRSSASSARTAAPRRPPRPERRNGGATALHTRSGVLALDRPVLVGVLNATPDSFSDGGRHLDPVRAAEAAVTMVADGAGALDLGAESTRPGALPVAADEQLRRLLPVLRAVRAAVTVPLSIDTTSAAVARAALGEGADIVNDVSAGRFDRAMLPLCAREQVPIVLMHMQGTPATMQRRPRYASVVEDVTAFLARRVAAARAAGIDAAAIIVDPGIGFGKTLEHNLSLLARLDLVAALGYPILVGVSRKGFIGALLGGVGPAERGHGTAAAVALAVAGGARLLRVHDVAAMRDVVAVAAAVAHA